MMYSNIINQQQLSFSGVHCIITFFLSIQPWTCMASSDDEGLMTALTSIKSPGEMDPKSLAILIGDNATITCRLSKPHSSDIWFTEKKSKQPINQPSNKIKIIDPYTAVLMIDNAIEQNSRYQCKVGDYAIGETELYVGTKPLDVTDFSCISHDYEKMECSFTIPKNNILTRFELEYTLPKDNSIYKCYCHSTENHQLKCNVTDYLPMRDTYIFTLKGRNNVGENIQTFEISNHKNVIPSAVDIIHLNISSNSVALSLQKLKISYYIKNGLTYDIQIRDKDSSWRTPQMGELECQNDTCNVVISNLYSFWVYWIKARVKSKAVDDDGFWSKEKTIKFQTKSEQPKRAPETPVGSFYSDSTETQLRVYWEQMPKYEHNGPGFHYIVTKINGQGVVMRSTKTNESSLTFAWKNESMQIFVIKSANDIGESTNGNVIRVYQSKSANYELNERSIAKVYHNGSYTLSWSPPQNRAELMNYTVFWCLPKIELPNQCKGPISYKYLDKLATNFTTVPKDHSLNLAISANYQNYNKGMQWARCSGDVSSELMKMELEVSVLNCSAILVKWNSGSVCASILKGYNLTYCQTSFDNECVTPTITVELLREKKDYRNYTISNLPPYTRVCLNMLMYSSSKQGRISDWNCVRTKAKAPLPPKNINYIRNTVTSKSAGVQWSPPDKTNGILRHYAIYWRKFQDQIFEKDTTSVEQTSYNLTGLNSYSKYEVYVTAYTIEESSPSSKITFTTLIGIPSSPRNLNISENNTVIYWEQPDLPSGNHLFYIVALIRRDENFNSIYERLSLVKGRNCRFHNPDCENSSNSYSLWVRAVNVGRREEVDQEIVAKNKEVIFAGAPIDERFCKEEKDLFDTDSFFENDSEMCYFASPWVVAPRSYSCSPSSKASIYAVALIIVIAFVAYICFWLRNKIHNMNNIKVILPEGLDPNYKYATESAGNGSNLGGSTKNEFHLDISRGNDCLVSNDHKEKLITNFHNGQANALLALSSSISCKNLHKDELIGENDLLETTNEEISSNSSSASNSHFTYQEIHRVKMLSPIDSNNTITLSGCEEDVAKRYSVNYVTFNSQLVSSILNTNEINISPASQLNSTFPNMTNDGYIQPSAAKQLFQTSLSHHQQSPKSINGYTCIESLEKLTSTDQTQPTYFATSQGITKATTTLIH